jgi:hypothetical protein
VGTSSRYVGIALTSIPLGLAGQAVVATQAGATVCAHGAHAGSTGCIGGGGIGGIEGQWHNNNSDLIASYYNNGDHINNEMWGYTKSDESNWVEEGIRHGVDPSDPCNCRVYEAFWAEIANNTEVRHTIVNNSPDGTNHVYEVQNVSGTNQWNVYYDNSLVGTSKYQSSNQMYQHQAGLEYSAPVDTNGFADTYNNFLQIEVSGTWKNWSAEDTWVDYGCNTHPAGYCLNGLEPQLSQFNDNKPWI